MSNMHNFKKCTLNYFTQQHTDFLFEQCAAPWIEHQLDLDLSLHLASLPILCAQSLELHSSC
jgi:hypothetical protein